MVHPRPHTVKQVRHENVYPGDAMRVRATPSGASTLWLKTRDRHRHRARAGSRDAPPRACAPGLCMTPRTPFHQRGAQLWRRPSDEGACWRARRAICSTVRPGVGGASVMPDLVLDHYISERRARRSTAAGFRVICRSALGRPRNGSWPRRRLRFIAERPLRPGHNNGYARAMTHHADLDHF